jgi:hypothetical protein
VSQPTTDRTDTVPARHYRRWRVMLSLLLITVLILADHATSLTFRANLGEGGLQTTLNQRQSLAGACAPCGAPCRPED